MLKEMIPAGLNRFLIPKEGPMNVECLVYLNPFLAGSFREAEALKQLRDAASLPGVVGRVIGMPDIHAGFGLPIGGVMACDAEKGIVSAGAVGMDINCGVRLLATDVPAADLKRRDLLHLSEEIKKRIPAGVGKKSRHPDLTRSIEDIIHGGAPEVVAMGYGRPEDLVKIEEGGWLREADLGRVSREARRRTDQLSTIGGGNHFVEIGYIAAVYDSPTAGTFGLREGCLSVLIHTGSRGFGHQICTDYTKVMAAAAPRYGIALPAGGLACVPVGSREGRDYLAAMACAANFAFANRQLITHDVRLAFGSAFGCDPGSLGLDLVYDVCHNIARFEEAEGRRLLVHRKGAVRALPPWHPLAPKGFESTGNPVLVPGSMGTASYVVVAAGGITESFCSANHGAGRTMSRTAARKNLSVEDLRSALGRVILCAGNEGKILDESPQAYKDIHAVIETLAEIGLTRKVAMILPLAVIKGED